MKIPTHARSLLAAIAAGGDVPELSGFASVCALACALFSALGRGS